MTTETQQKINEGIFDSLGNLSDAVESLTDSVDSIKKGCDQLLLPGIPADESRAMTITELAERELIGAFLQCLKKSCELDGTVDRHVQVAEMIKDLLCKIISAEQDETETEPEIPY